MIDDYFDLPFDELCQRASVINKEKTQIQASPTIVDEACATVPPCRHCKWEYFKAKGIQTGRRRELCETAQWAKHLWAQGIRRTFLASGWMGYKIPAEFLRQAETVRENSDLEIYGLFGALDKQSLIDLRSAGMQGYLCSLESPSEAVYRSFRPGGDNLEDRLRAIDWAAGLGLSIWSGFLVGLGETEDDIKNGVKMLTKLNPVSLSVLPFTPFPNTRMVDSMPASPYTWARAAATATLAIPQADVFGDQAVGMYRPYADLFAPNGAYVVPKV